jgi:hypothetical protein
MKGGEGEGVVFCFFPLFPMCSHGVPPKFLSCPQKIFPIAPQFYRILFAQSSTPMYKKIGHRVQMCSYFDTWGQKRCLYREVPNF